MIKRLIPFFVVLAVGFTGVAKAGTPENTAGTDTLKSAYVAFKEGDYVTARNLWKPLAEAGNEEAAYRLGCLYAEGKGASKNLDEAIEWFLISARKGHDQAQINAATAMIAKANSLFREKGITEQQNAPIISIQLYEAAASQGRTDIQTFLGMINYYGFLVPQNDLAAVEWFRMAAGNGLPDAQYYMGYLLTRNRSAIQDGKEAVMWLHKSANQNYAPGQFNLAGAYFDGIGVKADDSKAYYWMYRASLLGFDDATSLLSDYIPLLDPGLISIQAKKAKQDHAQQSSIRHTSPAYLKFSGKPSVNTHVLLKCP